MSEEVKRYAFDKTRGEMFEIAKGAYVSHDDYDALRAKLVKACIMVARMWMSNGTRIEAIISRVSNDHGIRLRWTDAGWKEDKG